MRTRLFRIVVALLVTIVAVFGFAMQASALDDTYRFDDIEMSGRTGKGKGENIRLLMERNHISKAVYVGDTVGDEKAARQAGIPFIYAAYGFGRAIRPDCIIQEIRDLPEALDQLME